MALGARVARSPGKMATLSHPPTDSRRAAVAVVVALAHLLLGYLLLTGLNVRIPARAGESLTVIALRPEPRPKPAPANASPVERPHEDSRRNLKAQPSEVVAPKVQTPVLPMPIVAAPLPGVGMAASAGASDRLGPGSGDGGFGVGGGRGGDGDGDEPWQPSKRIAGKIRDSDYPPDAKAVGIGGTTRVHFTVGVDGRVSNCRIAESSGSAELDSATCRLITERFRYRPARDQDGNAVPDEWFGENEWIPR